MSRLAVDKAGKSLLNPNTKLVNLVGSRVLPQVTGDANKCTQLLYNLVTNACKFTAKGTITISAEHSAGEGVLELKVADTGKGIAPDALERIFEPFEQENSKDTRSFQGIGLGLSVSLGIAKLHGGNILVDSKVGEGSVFTVQLPCTPACAEWD